MGVVAFDATLVVCSEVGEHEGPFVFRVAGAASLVNCPTVQLDTGFMGIMTGGAGVFKFIRWMGIGPFHLHPDRLMTADTKLGRRGFDQLRFRAVFTGLKRLRMGEVVTIQACAAGAEMAGLHRMYGFMAASAHFHHCFRVRMPKTPDIVRGWVIRMDVTPSVAGFATDPVCFGMRCSGDGGPHLFVAFQAGV